MAKGGAEQYVTDYHLSLHLGLCVDSVDKITGLEIGEKHVSIEEQDENSVIEVDNKNLFGGPKKGGGIKGRIWFLFGRDDQVMPEELAIKHGRTSATMPAYRGLTSLFFTALEGVEGFLFGANNPVVPSIAVIAQRAPKGLAPVDAPEDAMIGVDANPAHILYELLTDTESGVGYSASQINEDSFLEAAETLVEEGFGLSYLWVTSMTVEQFVNEILQTISANLLFNMATGKWDLKLLRGDYDPNKLPEINPGNARLVSFQRKGWGETINEIVVTWTNPANEGEETVVSHDNANISIQGTIVSDSSKNYPGIRNGNLALRVAERDLRQASAPLAAAQVEIDRSLWNLKPGDVALFRWPERRIETPLVMRVLRMDHKSKGSAGMTASLMEDVFSFGVSPTDFDDGNPPVVDQEPIDPPFHLIDSAPYYLNAVTFGDGFARAIEFPDMRAWIMAATKLTDIRDIDVLTELPNASGDLEYQEIGTIDEPGRFLLPSVLPIELTSTFVRPTGEGRAIAVGGFLLLVNPADQTIQELALITDVVGLNITIQRGALDTVPLAWPVDTVVWAMNGSTRMVDRTERAAGETAKYKFLPITSLGRLDEADSTERTKLLNDRHYRPLRPANLLVDDIDIFEGDAIVSTATDDTLVSWATRNRVTETSLVLAWNAGSATPEEDQTTTIEIYDGASLVDTFDGLTGTSRVITNAEFGAPGHNQTRRIELYSVRDDFESLMRSTRVITFKGENLLGFSHDFSSWTGTAGQTAGAADGPVSGVAGASKIKMAASGTVHQKATTFAVVDTVTYTVVGVFKKAEIDMVRFFHSITGFPATGFGRTFNLNTGADAALFGTVVASGTVSLGSGWFLCYYTFVANQTGTATLIIRLDDVDSAGDGTSGIYADHTQVERGAVFSGFYIRTP